ncbi:MAG: hypothetical protein E1N59_172 [Puniceicoccaceae bacterium 5H]|nr:MAG: hypothetical protein E1N59_172 [Puniceicoccaceae bacterium 5H]
MSTCLCDAFFDDVARATVEVLEFFGCTVDFPENQTCCGQPAFNGGDWKAARTVARHQAHAFAGDQPVIVPSGSCAAMVFHGNLLAFEKETDLPEMEDFARRTWELCDFLVNGLGVEAIPGRYQAKVAVHNSCHTRGSGTGAAMDKLLRSIDGVEVVKIGEPEQCCGFGGTFSVAFPNISSSMGKIKIENLQQEKPDLVVSGDMSCLMHMRGLAQKAGVDYNAQHVVQLIRDALRNEGAL